MKNVLKKYLFSDVNFYKELILIGIPIVIQNLLTSSLNLVDTLMVGRLGERAIAAVGAANQIFFIFNFIMIGISAGCGIFISQYHGKQDASGMRWSLGLSLQLSVIFGVFFMAAAFIVPEQIAGMFQNSPGFIQSTSMYFRIVCFSYPMAAVTTAFASSLKSIGKTVIPMATSAVGICLNVLLNYILIFGKAGFAPMGIQGAAIATLIARAVEMLLMIAQIHLGKTVFAVPVKMLFTFNREFRMKLMKPIFHTVGNELVWSTGVVAYTIAYGKLGETSLAVSQIYSVLQNVFSVLFYGIASASIVLVGREIGQNQIRKACDLGRRFVGLALQIAVILSITLILTAPFLVELFSLEQETSRLAVLTIRIAAFPFIAFAVNTVMLTGVLRGGGDTRIPLMIEACTMWCFGVPLAFISCVLLKLPIFIAIPLVNLEEIIKLVIFTRRLLRGKWAVNLVEQG